MCGNHALNRLRTYVPRTLMNSRNWKNNEFTFFAIRQSNKYKNIQYLPYRSTTSKSMRKPSAPPFIVVPYKDAPSPSQVLVCRRIRIFLTCECWWIWYWSALWSGTVRQYIELYCIIAYCPSAAFSDDDRPDTLSCCPGATKILRRCAKSFLKQR